MTQADALNILKTGRNVFLTGAAGSGKTHVLNEYVAYLKRHAVDVAVTASTGIAATHLGGMTIHAWSGLGVRSMLSDADIDAMMERQYLYKRFERTRVLIVDEISMLHHFRLDMIDWICRKFKRNDAPFGGMQVILCGDFFQLPPVSPGESTQSEFAYNAQSWADAKLVVCYLSEQHRQKDAAYLRILNEIRRNAVSEETKTLLSSRLNRDPDSGLPPTKVFTHNIDVDIINNRHLDLINGPLREYAMDSRGPDHLVEMLQKSCLSPARLLLKEGARVMFTKNEPEGRYVNGTLGLVSGFNTFGDPLVTLANGKEIAVQPSSWTIEEEGKIKAEITQLPLRLAWAITVHKSQGMSLDAMELDLSKSFVAGMGYVALSRVRSLGGMKLLGLNEMALTVDREILAADKHFQELSRKAEATLAAMSTSEIEKRQKDFMRSIEPEEKKKIKILEKQTKKSTEELTEELLREKKFLTEIARKRGLKPETIIAHIEGLVEKGNIGSADIEYLRREFKRGELEPIIAAFAKAKTKTLMPVFNILYRQKKKPTYAKIRLARLFTE